MLKKHGSTKSNVSSRVESSQVEFGPKWLLTYTKLIVTRTTKHIRLQHGYHAAVNCLDLCSVAFAFENCYAFHTFNVPRFPVPRFQRPLDYGSGDHLNGWLWLQFKVREGGLGLRTRLNDGRVCDAYCWWGGVCGLRPYVSSEPLPSMWTRGPTVAETICWIQILHVVVINKIIAYK